SLPGFGFSSPLCTPGINYWRTADLWVQLMEQLGYSRFAAHGADWGATITAQLGHRYADRVIGIHVCGALTLGSWAISRPWAELLGTPAARAPEELRPAVIEWEKNRASHLTVQVIEPQTVAYALTDSPLGLAAWILERRRNWADPRDLSTVMDVDDL